MFFFRSPAISLSTSCALYVAPFPYDIQTSLIKFTSFSYVDAQIFYSEESSSISIRRYIEHIIWSLVSTSIKSSSFIGVDNGFNVSNNTNNTLVLLSLNFKRNALFYMINSVFPCFILNSVTLSTFSMPFANGLNLGD